MSISKNKKFLFLADKDIIWGEMKGLNLRKNKYKGTLIVFEGTDGAGKTTLISMTEEYINNRLRKETLVVKQPTEETRKTRLWQICLAGQIPLETIKMRRQAKTKQQQGGILFCHISLA